MSRFKFVVLALVGGGALLAYALFLRSTSTPDRDREPPVTSPTLDPRFLEAARDRPQEPPPPAPPPPAYSRPLRYEDLVPPPPPPAPSRPVENPHEELERATGLTAIRSTATVASEASPNAVSSHRVPRRTVTAGTLIEAQLHQPLRTDQASTVIAQSLRPIYDAYNRTVVLPAGTRFLGTVATSQLQDAGAEVHWHRLITPDGRSLELGEPATSTDDNGGDLDGRRRAHRGQKAAAILVTALTTTALEAARGDGTTVSLGATAGADAVSGTETVVSRWAQRALARPPTIHLEAGTTFFIRVLSDISL